jgi:hypothetical protein
LRITPFELAVLGLQRIVERLQRFQGRGLGFALRDQVFLGLLGTDQVLLEDELRRRDLLADEVQQGAL